MAERLINANELKAKLSSPIADDFASMDDIIDLIDAMPTVKEITEPIVNLGEPNSRIYVELCKYPTEEDWLWVKQCTLVTVGKKTDSPPSAEFKHKILNARHSPIRALKFGFYIECPSWVATHLSRHHVGAQPFIRSQRNDRQGMYDRNAARQDTGVQMMWELNAEALMTIANKRLCNLASRETREVVQEMSRLVLEKCPEFNGLLVPHCEYYGKCHEMFPCGKMKTE